MKKTNYFIPAYVKRLLFFDFVKSAKLIFSFLFFILIINIKVNAQTTCSTAGTIIVQNPPVDYTLGADSRRWFKFVADSANAIVHVTYPISPSQIPAHLKKIKVYSGVCSSLTLLYESQINYTDTSTLTASLNNLSSGNTYFIEVVAYYNSTTGNYGSFSASVSRRAVCTPIPATACNLIIKNGDFTNVAGVVPPAFPACHWETFIASPQVYTTPVGATCPVGNYAAMWAHGGGGFEGIRQDLTNANRIFAGRKYFLRFDARNSHGHIPSSKFHFLDHYFVRLNQQGAPVYDTNIYPPIPFVPGVTQEIFRGRLEWTDYALMPGCSNMIGTSFNANADYNRIYIFPRQTPGNPEQAWLFIDNIDLFEIPDAGPDQVVQCGNSVTIGNPSPCPPPTVLSAYTFTYNWTSNPVGTTGTTSSIIVNPSVPTTYYLDLTVTQAGGPSYHVLDTVFVNVSCNKINNGCFENYSTLPTALDQITKANNWNKFALGVPDYYHQDVTSFPVVDVPQGSVNARSGKGMAGIRCYTDGANQRDYLLQNFTTPLASGTYYAEMYVNLKDESRYPINTLGMFFCTGTAVQCTPPFHANPITSYTPQVISSNYLCHGWTKVSGCFTIPAGKSASKMVIGNFKNDANSGVNTSSPVLCTPPSVNDQSYYFIDDVLVEKLEVEAGNPQTITCGQTVQIGSPGSCSSMFTYSWSPTAGLTNPNSAVTDARPTVTTTYTLTATAPSGCSFITDAVTITVNPIAPPTCSTCTLTTCFNTPSLTLTGGLPAGGFYSGTNVSAGQFNVAAAGSGVHQIFYNIGSVGCTTNIPMYVEVQPCDWAVQTTGTITSDHKTYAVTTDNNTGDIFVVGSILGTVDFGNGVTSSSVPLTQNNFFIAKYNDCGEAQWVNTATTTSSAATDESTGLAITLDDVGDVYVTGKFRGEMTFNGGGATLNSTSPKDDIFIAKFHTNGGFMNGANGGGMGEDAGLGVAYKENTGTVLVTGYVEEYAELYPSIMTGGPMVPFPFIHSFQNVFVAEYDRDLQALWAKNFDANSNTIISSGTGITVDRSNPRHFYVTGYLEQYIDFGPNAFGSNIYANTSSGMGDIEAFIVKFENNGIPVWANNTYALSSVSNCRSNGVACDNSGNPYITGSYNGTIAFGAAGSVINFAGAGSVTKDIFVARYDAMTGSEDWVRSEGEVAEDEGLAINTDAVDQIYTTGYFTGSAPFYGTYLNGFGSTDVFVAKYDDAGSGISIAKEYGGLNDDKGMGIVIHSHGDAYIAGSFMGPSADFSTAPSTIMLSTSSSNNEAFLKKICDAQNSFRIGHITDIADPEIKNMFKLYPNPNNGTMQLDYELSGSQKGKMMIYNLAGQEISKYDLLEGANTLQINESELKDGIYFYQMKINNMIIKSGKVVIIK
jgi:hypothetical protein